MKIVIDSKNLNSCLTSDEDDLLKNIKEICDEICLTSRIQDEYAKPPNYLSGLLPELKKLERFQPKKLTSPKLGAKREINGVGSQHIAFLEEAVRIKADFFITRNPAWLQESKNLVKNYGLRIVTPEQYISERKNNN